MQTQWETSVTPEHSGYFAVPGAHLCTILHHVPNPVARVLLVGPFASERHFSYHVWVRWARFLAARRIEVLRYDYRGIGESTGIFEEMSFEHWSEDLDLLAAWFASRSSGVPLLLHGLEIGAILAARGFHRGIGDGLLLWSPPDDANQALRMSLVRWAALEQILESPKNRIPASEYIRQLEQGSSIEVQGYHWSSRLWMDSFTFKLPVSFDTEGSSATTYKRPVKTVKFGKNGSSVALPYPRHDPETKDLSALYASSFEWIVESLTPGNGGGDENIR